MEKRAILAFALSAALLFLYVWVEGHFFAPPPTKTTEGPPAQRGSEDATKPPAPGKVAPPATPDASRPSQATPLRPPELASKGRPPQRTATVEAPAYRAVVSSEGGKLQEWTLHYRGDKPMVVVGDLGPAGLVLGVETASPATVPMTLPVEPVVLSAAQPEAGLGLNGDADGLRVSQTMRFAANRYTVDVHVRVENAGSSPRKVTVVLPWSTRLNWKGVSEKFAGQHPTDIVVASGGGIQHTQDLAHPGWDYGCMSTILGPHKEHESIDRPASAGDWIALGSSYYMAAFMPKTPGFRLRATADVKGGDPGRSGNGPEGYTTVAVEASQTIAGGQVWEGRVVLFAGPKEYELLRDLGLEGAIDFGGFPAPRRCGGLPMEWLGVPILQVMKWVYRHVGNYGVAIILLTLVTRILFYPLTVKSVRSMKAMQALTPQINALRAKYKSDPQRQQRETMDLYRKHRVNPMGGCLPMVAQIPIFYALYLALAVAVELQGASFLCLGRLPPWTPFVGGADIWICDLASHDPLYVLPLLMGVTMFIQQKMTPAMGDPRQAKMMLFMPVVFTFMFLNLPSGLVLYWTVSNVLQIAQQWYMNRPKATTRAERPVKDASRA